MRFDVHPSASIFMATQFTAARHLVIKRNSVINAGCHIDVRGEIIIGENVSISDQVSLVTGDHNPADPHFRARFRSIIIEDHVFIGHRSVILGNIVIGKGAVIAAGSVVTANVPSFTIVGGVPAKKIGERTKELLRDKPYSRLFH